MKCIFERSPLVPVKPEDSKLTIKMDKTNPQKCLVLYNGEVVPNVSRITLDLDAEKPCYDATVTFIGVQVEGL